MTVEEAIVIGKKQLSSTHTKMLLADVLGVNPLELFQILQRDLLPEQEAQFCKNLKCLQEEKPIQYVLGNVNFYGNTFHVDERVLIPRFETEQLVEKTLERIQILFPQEQGIKIIDLGCGSGVIGLTLKSKLPTAEVTLVDLSLDALQVASENAKDLGLDVTLLEADFLTDNDQMYNVLISNPPYIKTTEEIEEIVRKNEPSLALYAGADGLDCYRKILATCKKNLAEKYLLAFEIGMTQGLEVAKLACEYLGEVDVEILPDLSGRDRFVFIHS